MSLHIQVITPEKTLIDQEASEVVVPTTTGELAILPQHIPLLSQIAPGIITIKHNSKEETLAVDGGFLQVTAKTVTILADFALHEREASASKAEEAKKTAEKAMKDKTSDADLQMLQDEVRRAVLTFQLSQKHKSH